MAETHENSLVIRSRNEVARPNVFSDFSLTVLVDEFGDKSRNRFLDKIGLGTAAAASAEKIKGSGQYVVDIPKDFVEGLKEGTLRFDSSTRIPGNMTPNIRDLDGNLVGQATIKNGVSCDALTSSAMNMAMMAMLADMSHKLDVIDEKIEAIQKGMQDDRVSKVVSGFQSFYLAFDSCRSEEELRQRAYVSFSQMNEGIVQLHFSLDREAKALMAVSPRNDFFSFLMGRTGVQACRSRYRRFENDLKLYYQLHMMLEVVSVFAFDQKSVREVHSPIANLSSRLFDDRFTGRMAYLNGVPAGNLLVSRMSTAESAYQEALGFNTISIEMPKEELRNYLN